MADIEPGTLYVLKGEMVGYMSFHLKDLYKPFIHFSDRWPLKDDEEKDFPSQKNLVLDKAWNSYTRVLSGKVDWRDQPVLNGDHEWHFFIKFSKDLSRFESGEWKCFDKAGEVQFTY